MTNYKLTNEELKIIERFYQEVCDMAEQKMLMTGKLEGAHFASMQQVIKEQKDLLNEK